MGNEKGYDVQTKIRFLLDFDDPDALNTMPPDIQKQFTRHIKKVYEQEDTLGGFIASDLYFHFDGRVVQLEYIFSCHDETRAKAESFSACCVRKVQSRLEEFGCKLKKIDCKAVEADMSWLVGLEGAVFGPKKEKKPDPRNKGGKHPGQER